jgi:hypothetical protein
MEEDTCEFVLKIPISRKDFTQGKIDFPIAVSTKLGQAIKALNPSPIENI